MEVIKSKIKSQKGLIQIISESIALAFALGYVGIILIISPLAIGKLFGHDLGLIFAIINIIIYIYCWVYKTTNFRQPIFSVVGLIMLVGIAALAHRLDANKDHDLWRIQEDSQDTR